MPYPAVIVYQRHPDGCRSVSSVYEANQLMTVIEFVNWLLTEDLLAVNDEFETRTGDVP